MAPRLYRFWLGLRVFLGMYISGKDGNPSPQRCTTSNNSAFYLYEPQGKATKSVLLITGIGMLGEADPRLMRLAGSLAARDLRVAVPVLDGLKSLRAAQSDLITTRDCLDYLLTTYPEPVCVIAFSTGGSIVMRLSTEAGFSERVEVMILFSPVYDPHSTWRTIGEIAYTPVHDHQNADNEMWLHTITAFRNYKTLGYTDAEKESIREYLARYTHGLPMEERIAFYKNLIANHPPNGHELFLESADLDAIAPNGRMSQSATRILVFHDSHDFVIPNEHIHALEHELNQRPVPNHRILITPALSHVNVNPQHISDIVRMIDMIGELFK